MKEISECYKFLLRKDLIDKYDVFVTKEGVFIEGKVSAISFRKESYSIVISHSIINKKADNLASSYIRRVKNEKH